MRRIPLCECWHAGSTVNSPLAISVVWCVYNALPHFLVLWYVLVSKGISLQYLCRFCILLSFFCGSIAVGLIWGLYPRTYSYKVSCSLLSAALPWLQFNHGCSFTMVAAALPWFACKPQSVRSYSCTLLSAV